MRLGSSTPTWAYTPQGLWEAGEDLITVHLSGHPRAYRDPGKHSEVSFSTALF